MKVKHQSSYCIYENLVSSFNIQFINTTLNYLHQEREKIEREITGKERKKKGRERERVSE